MLDDRARISSSQNGKANLIYRRFFVTFITTSTDFSLQPSKLHSHLITINKKHFAPIFLSQAINFSGNSPVMEQVHDTNQPAFGASHRTRY
jgi:hypothetical protein